MRGECARRKEMIARKIVMREEKTSGREEIKTENKVR